MVRSQFRTRGRRGVLAAYLGALLLTGLGVKFWQNHRVPSPDAEAGPLSRYMAGRAFAALPDTKKAPYLKAFQRANDRGRLTPEQQHGVISNLINPSGRNPIQQYFSLPPGKERDNFLDDVIDRVLKEDKRRPPPDKQGAKEMQIDGGRLADTIPPQDRAQMDQFLQDLHDRRAARGVSDDGKFLFNITH